jgi:hypothetical protein
MKIKIILIFFLILLLLNNFSINSNNNIESFKSKKYLYLENYNHKYGLSHQKGNYYTLIKYCYFNDYILLSPNFLLESRHNNNKLKITNFSEYFDIENVKVNSKKLEIIGNYKKIENILKRNKINVKIIAGKKLSMFFRNSPIFSNLKNVNIEMDYNKELVKIANNIIKKLGKYTCVHVRRGDRMGNNKYHNKATTSDNIISKLKEIKSVKNVYIMTDEINKKHFLKISNHYKLYLYDDFKILKNIKKYDNYKLFCIENIIMNNANKKISTFKVRGKKYNNYLYEKSGWQ